MRDLISRQVAIGALGDIHPLDYNGQAILKKIKALPSAEEMAFNEWCTDCKEYDHENHCCPRFNRVIRETVEEVKEAHEEMRGRWIPVSERLPREYTRVIGYMAWHSMTAIEYQHGKWYSIDHLEPLPDEAVSHWMPLPKPPKGGDK